MAKEPAVSYTIWFAQRVGSTVLCRALADTGIAGSPDEHLLVPGEGALPDAFQADTYEQVRAILWRIGMTPNGVFGLKHGLHEPHFSWLIAELRKLPGVRPDATRIDVWQHAFPNHRHVFMTRMNKVRLAVSWWKAACTGEWHRQKGERPGDDDLGGKYSFPAIRHLVEECVLREAAIQTFLEEGDVRPLTILYEDLSLDFRAQVEAVLGFLDLPLPDDLPEPAFERMADAVSEEWVERFREEMQRDWDGEVW